LCQPARAGVRTAGSGRSGGLHRTGACGPQTVRSRAGG